MYCCGHSYMDMLNAAVEQYNRGVEPTDRNPAVPHHVILIGLEVGLEFLSKTYTQATLPLGLHSQVMVLSTI